MGSVSDDGLRQNNSDRSEGPWGRAEVRSCGGAHKRIVPDTEQGILMEAESTKDDGKPVSWGRRRLISGLEAVPGKTRRTEF
jgi:hypothetical protein